MRYPVAETAEKHDRVLNEAARLFRERGFENVNVAEIMQAAGLTHGTFYAHFDSKEALATKATERGLQEMVQNVGRAMATGEPRDAFLHQYLSRRHRDTPGHGCAIATLAPEIARRDREMRSAFTSSIQQLIGIMKDGFRWKSRRTARRESIQCLSTIVGAMILSRAVDSKQFSDEILNVARTSYGLTSL